MPSPRIDHLHDRIAQLTERARLACRLLALLALLLLVGEQWGPIARTLVTVTVIGASIAALAFLWQLSAVTRRAAESALRVAVGLEALASSPERPLEAPPVVSTTLEERTLELLAMVRAELERRGRVGEDLDRRVFEATTLYDLMIKMSSSLRLEEVLKMALYSSMGVFGVTEGLLLLLGQGNDLTLATTRLVGEAPERDLRIACDPGMSSGVASLHVPTPWGDLEKMEAFASFAGSFARSIPGFRPEVACPLDVHGQFLGFMLLGSKISREPFTKENLEFLDTISSAIALVIKNAQMVRTLEETNRQLDRRVNELTLLNEISRRLNVVGDLGQVVSSVLELSASGVGCEGAVVHLFDPPSQGLVRTAICGPLPYLQGPHAVPLGSGLLGSVGQSLRPVNVGPGHPFSPEELGFEPTAAVVSILAVPLTIEKRLVGVLSMVNKQGGAAFSPMDATWMQTTANHAASVIENMRLFKLATEDGLTGLYVHRYFQIRLREEMSRALRHGRPLSLLMADIDHFKLFNDRHGHQAGDAVLREVARTLKGSLREMDVAARYGGEELSVILPDTDQEGAVAVGERIRSSIERHRVGHESQELAVTVSVGVASLRVAEPLKFPKAVLDAMAANLVKSADVGLYSAKTAGRNRVVAGETISGV
ncbi:MAG: diguanylate cyclase [Candidatus Riflebacteria bacterium]|nr:diguanylate cyclase [Candidatus Riflebacteria bacterium]